MCYCQQFPNAWGGVHKLQFHSADGCRRVKEDKESQSGGINGVHFCEIEHYKAFPGCVPDAIPQRASVLASNHPTHTTKHCYFSLVPDSHVQHDFTIPANSILQPIGSDSVRREVTELPKQSTPSQARAFQVLVRFLDA